MKAKRKRFSMAVGPYVFMLLCLALMLPGLLAANAGAQEIRYEKETVMILEKQIEIVKTADNFIVLLDTSSSMGQPYKDTGRTELEAAKQILRERNAFLPGLTYNAGLFTYTPKTGFYTKTLKAYYDLKPYNKAAFANAIEQLPNKASGPTLLELTLEELDAVLSKLSGRTAIFLFSDGSYTHIKNKKRPVVLARELAEKYDVCFYVINTAEGEDEKEILKNVASINACSRVIRFSDLLDNPEYFAGALFVIEERILALLKTRLKPVVVQPKAEAKVVAFKMDNILFDFDSAEIQPAFYDELDALGAFMQRNTEAYVIL
ncbi:VWA domain-containing protein, partial [Thermodesulfobacteriota bacterium]